MSSSQQVVAQTPQESWLYHMQRAVRSFIKTAVVIDNEPWVDLKGAHEQELTAFPAEDSGLGDAVGPLISPAPEGKVDVGLNFLDIRKVSDTFAEQGVACAFVLPEDKDTEINRIKYRVVCAAKSADVVVIDWYLRPKNSSLTLQLLREIAESDSSENGRMRLICIYTGEPLDKAILDQAKEQLAINGVVFEDADGIAHFPFCSKSSHCLIALANKDETKADVLPGRLIDLFSHLADGLIPAFALAAIGAIRKNTHHMLTRFSSSLDSAYIANRLITNPPGDVAELMRELLVAECDNALGLDSVADDYLERESISKWLDVKETEFSPTQYKGKVNGANQNIDINKAFVNELLCSGVGDREFTDGAGRKIEFSEFSRNKVSEVLAGGQAHARIAENEFSRLVAFRREAFGSSTSLLNPSWRPSLTTGTVLRFLDGENTRYLMCFTPACDALRIEEPRPFVFLEGRECTKPYNLVVKEDDGRSVGLYFDKKYPSVLTFLFSADQETQRVRGIKKAFEGDGVNFVFNSAGELSKEFTWLGEIRYSRAASEMASLANVWMRIGIVDSEYLRLAGKGRFDFG
ncbi:response regulator receiver domain [Pseudomonas sp. 2FG]|uniref:response regulator receiver domain n=1 Tax=Pseudomonas sp. 2FG TaxID=2502191 RepID=UPI0010F77362|nr:response regulator receiver domain [Pseudomonas sp. 2FG]